MSIDHAQVRAALTAFGPGTSLDIASEHSELLRYARSRVTAQHSEQRLRVRVRVNRGGRVATGTLETLQSDAVSALSGKLEDALSIVGPGTQTAVARTRTNDDEPSAAESVGAPPRLSTPAERYAWFATIRDGLGESAELGGSIRNDVVERVVADAEGLFRTETVTKTSLNAIAERDGRSASFRALRSDPAHIDVAPVAQQLRSELTQLPTREAFSGACRVLLRPQAAIALIATYGYAALGAAGYAEGRTAVAGKLGEPVVSELITLVDDGGDPAGIPSRFDASGTSRRRTQLIDRGSLVGVVSDEKRADVTGGTPTGHGVPLGWRFGADPSPSHLLLEAGTTGDDELIAELGEGLFISRLDYLRVLHPKDTLVTGTTRDATYWVEDGRIVAWHPPVRLTFRLADVLSAVVAVGRERQCGEQPFMESIVAPALLIDAGPIVL